MSSMSQRRCARCGGVLGRSTGTSSIYRREHTTLSHLREILLCEPCFFEEEAQTEEAGTNNLPSVLDNYARNMRLNGDL